MIPSIPSLRFDNRTEFDALHFDTIDQNGVPFHVIVAKTGYRLMPGGAEGRAKLVPTDKPMPLYDLDHHYDDDLEKSVRVESDLAPYKPFCDVVIIGEAFPPANLKENRFDVGLRVNYPDAPAPMPERPRPLNPLQALSPAVFEEWQQRVAVAEKTRVPGKVLIDKTLSVTGERYLRKHAAPVRAVGRLLRIASLGMIQPAPWRLTSSEPATAIPLRYESAPGGECRVERSSGLIRRIPPKHRLTDEQAVNYPSPPGAPDAHDSSQQNPVGCGFSRTWYLDATRTSELPAPRIEYPARPFSAGVFWSAAKGESGLETAGMGFIGRGWLPRRQLVGTVEEKANWEEGEIPLLPKDFDFRYWNGAPDDQQCPHLVGGEQFTLTNLSHPSTVAEVDGAGNRQLTFALPQQSLFVMAATEAGGVAALPLAIDTVIIDMETEHVELVWRLAMVADGDFDEVRLIHATEPAQLARLKELQISLAEQAPLDIVEHTA